MICCEARGVILASKGLQLSPNFLGVKSNSLKGGWLDELAPGPSSAVQ